MKDIFNILLREIILLEFTEKVIYQLVQKFTKEGGPKEDVIRIYIQRFKQIQNKVEQKDPFKYTWKEFERVVDANQTSRIKAGKLDPTVSDANLIYSQGGIRVYVGKDKKSCIKYGGGYSWCISARGEDNMYASYRLSNPYRQNTPYFIFNDNLSSEREGTSFVDDNHALVIFVEYDTDDDVARQFRYSITTAANDGDIDYYDLEDIQEDFPWITRKIFNLIKPVAPPDEEVQADRIEFVYKDGISEKLVDVDLLDGYQGLKQVIPGNWYQLRAFILELTYIADKVGAEKFLAAIENKKFLITKAVIDSWFMTSPGDTPESLRKDNHEPRGTYTDYFWVLTGSEEDLIKKIQDFLPTLEKDPDHNYYGGPSVHAIDTADLIPIYQNKRVHNDMEYIAMTIRDLQTERDSALSKLKLGIKN
jgi:hypothetical protein